MRDTTIITPAIKRRALGGGAALIAVVASLSMTGCVVFSGAHYRETRNLVAEHEQGAAIALETANGGVTIRRADVYAVEITANVRARTQERLEATRIIAAPAGGALRISVEWPEGRRLGSEGCSFDVLLPSADGAQVRTSNGSIEIDGLAGLADLRSSNGRITVRDHLGDVDAHSSNGRITAERVAGGVRADTSNGGVTVLDVGGPVDVGTSNGSVRIALAPDNPGPVRAASSNGAIDAALSPAFAGELRASTSNGVVHFEGGDLRPRVLRMGRRTATLSFGEEGAAAPSRLRTSNGSIRIRVQTPVAAARAD